jgi:4-aminobutyrate aminotransferase/(S)-3-amino-2-methylpropionate transaminase
MARRLVELSERYGIVGDVRGLGMMRALELVRDRRTK